MRTMSRNRYEIERLDYACDLVIPEVNQHGAAACHFFVWLFLDQEDGLIQYADASAQDNFRLFGSLYQRCLDEDIPAQSEWSEMRCRQRDDGMGKAGWCAAYGKTKGAAKAAADFVSYLAQERGATREECEEVRYAARIKQFWKGSALMKAYSTSHTWCSLAPGQG